MYIKFPCSECDAKGQTVQRKRVTVPVPAGIEDGQTVRMNVGSKELFITFKVEKSRYFKRDGADVHTDAEISLSQAILGGTIRIQGVYEDQTIQIMPGTSSHHTITLSGKGMKRVNSIGSGDHYIHLKIVIPKRLTDKQKALVQAYAELEKDTPGQIFGVTFKSDGESSENISEKQTQRPKDEDTYYEEHDTSDTDQAKRKDVGPQAYYMLGIVMFIFIVLLIFAEKSDEILQEERERNIAEFQKREKKRVEFDEA